MKCALTLAGLAFLLSLPNIAEPVLADEIHLKTGVVLKGRIVEEGDAITIDLKAGQFTVSADQIEAIFPGRTLLHDFQDKRAAIQDSTQASDFFSLAFWAKSNGLSQFVRPLLKHTIALDPQHIQARTLLGYVLFEGKWLTKSQSLRAQGLVRYRGKWMKAEERDAILAKLIERREERRQEREQRALALRDQRAQRAWNRRYSGDMPFGNTYGNSIPRRRGLLNLGWQSSYSGSYYTTCSPFGPSLQQYPLSFYKKLIIKIP